MKQIFLLLVLASCTSPKPSPAASLTPIPTSTSAPTLSLCAPPEETKLSELKGWGLLHIGMTTDDLQKLLSQHNIKPQVEESRGYAPARAGEPVVHSTFVNISFTCDSPDGSIIGKASLDPALRSISSLSIIENNILEQEAKLILNRLEANYGKPSRSHAFHVEGVLRDDRCWINNSIEFCAVLIQTKDQYRSTWSLHRQYGSAASQ